MDNLGHIIRHVSQQGGEQTPFRYGHISVYDPELHRVRCIIPSMTDQDGSPLLSPWMPLGTLSAGGGAGIQVFYEGGATVENPTAGEQCLICTFDRQRGVSAVPVVFFHPNSLPPSTNLPTQQDGFSAGASASAPGDVIISTASSTEGGANSFVRIRKDGTIQIWSAGQVSANIMGGLTAVVNTGDVEVTVAQGNATVTAHSGTISLLASAIRLGSAAADALLQLVNSRLIAIFNSHIHPNGGVPAPQAPPNTVTTIVTAE